MSGRVASFTVFETGWPELKSSKWSPPTSRATKTACLPSPISSCQTTHGTVVPPGFSVPAATRGFSASRRAIALSVHASSASWLSAQSPNPCAPEVSRMLVRPAVPFPTATQRKPPSAVASATIFAAKTMSLLRSPSIWLGSSSYQTTHATVSFGPVNAMSGSTPQRFAAALKRLAKMFVGQPAAALGSYHATQGTVRPAPAKSIDGASASSVGSMLSDAGDACVTQAPFLNARTKICCSPSATFCSNVAYGTGTFPAVTAPPATSETPASWFGSIALARSLFTCEPLAGSGRKPARVAGATSSTDRAARPAIVRRRRLAGMVISESRECMRDSSYFVRGASGPGWMPSRIWAAGICLRLGYVRATPKDAKNPLPSRWGAVDDSEGGPAPWETHALRHQARRGSAPTPIWRPLPRQSVVTEGRRDGTTPSFSPLRNGTPPRHRG